MKKKVTHVRCDKKLKQKTYLKYELHIYIFQFSKAMQIDLRKFENRENIPIIYSSRENVCTFQAVYAINMQNFEGLHCNYHRPSHEQKLISGSRNIRLLRVL